MVGRAANVFVVAPRLSSGRRTERCVEGGGGGRGKWRGCEEGQGEEGVIK